MELNRTGAIERLQSRMMSIDEFNFDQLMAPPLLSLLTVYDVDRLYNIATSVRYSGNAHKKFKAIDEIMKPRGFIKISGGTNRLCYGFYEDQSICTKIAYDSIAIKDTPGEFKNQMIFKPFVTKVFEVSSCGTVGLFERVDPITSREEFLSVADDIYEVITKWFFGKWLMPDIGTKFFMNWGIRRGFGPVVLDFPYCYEIDGNKLYCSAPNINSPTGKCGGLIDVDDGFNFLYCERCGTRYRMRELAKAVKDESIIVQNKGGRTRMKVATKIGDTVISESKDSDHVLSAAAQSIKKSKENIRAGKLQIRTKMVKVAAEQSEQNATKSTESQVTRKVQTQSNQPNRGLAIRGEAGNIQVSVKNGSDQNSNLEDRINELEKELKKKQDTLNKALSLKSDYEKEVKELKARISELDIERLAYEEKYLKAEAEVEKLQKETNISTDKGDIDTTDKITELKEALKAAEADKTKELAQLEEIIKSRDSLINQLEERSNDFKRQIVEKDIQIEDLKENLKVSAKELKDTVKQVNSDWNKKVKDLEKKVKELDKAIKGHISKQDEDAFNINELEQVIQSDQEKIGKLVNALRAIAGRLIPKNDAGLPIYECADFAALNGTIQTVGEVTFNNEREDANNKIIVFYDSDGTILSDGAEEPQVIAMTSIGGHSIDYLVPDSLADIEGIDPDIYNAYLSDLETIEKGETDA